MSGEVLYEVGEVRVADPLNVTGSGPGGGRVDLGRKDLDCVAVPARVPSRYTPQCPGGHHVFLVPNSASNGSRGAGPVPVAVLIFV